MITFVIFSATFLPFLANFITGRLIMQTDLVMVARFGESATAAFAIPLRIMILDMIVAFAFAPAVSVMVGRARSDEERAAAVGRAMTAAAISGVILTLCGLLLYPQIVRLVAPNPEIASLAGDAVFWLTLAIPARILQFVGSMAAHGCGRGGKLIPMNIFGLFLNGALNYVLMFTLSMGFKGSYQSTFLCALVTLAWTLFILREPTGGRIFRPLTRKDFSELVAWIAPEFWRLSSERLQAFVLLWMFSTRTSVSALSAFAVAMEFASFIFMPGLAAMRATAVVLARRSDVSLRELYGDIAVLTGRSSMLAALIGLLIAACGSWLGQTVYRMTPETLFWWHPFCILMIVWLPLRVGDAFQRGAWQAKALLRPLFVADAATQWLIVIPLVYLSLRHESPWGAWGALFAGDAIAAAALYLMVARSRFRERTLTSAV